MSSRQCSRAGFCARKRAAGYPGLSTADLTPNPCAGAGADASAGDASVTADADLAAAAAEVAQLVGAAGARVWGEASSSARGSLAVVCPFVVDSAGTAPVTPTAGCCRGDCKEQVSACSPQHSESSARRRCCRLRRCRRFQRGEEKRL